MPTPNARRYGTPAAQERERQLEIVRLAAQQLRRREAHRRNLSAKRFHVGAPLPQLRQVLSSGQSAGVAQEDEQQGPVAPAFRRHGVAIEVLEQELGRRIAAGGDHSLETSAES